MNWKLYRVVFRVRAPLHIGCGKIGNLQRTRHYVTGRAFWGALTMRLTRDAFEGQGPAIDSRVYREFANEIHRSLSYTYFYPTLLIGSTYSVVWPWIDQHRFIGRFLGCASRSTIARHEPHRYDAGEVLHEVEYIASRTSDSGEPVYLSGYVFERDDCSLAWKSACNRLQFGGERGYGWGDVECIEIREHSSADLFDSSIRFNVAGEIPVISLVCNEQSHAYLPAHAPATLTHVSGKVEPFVGREWRSDSNTHRYSGQHVEFNGMYFVPGAVVRQTLNLVIGEYGLLHTKV